MKSPTKIQPAKDLDTEIQVNYEKFERLLPELMKTHPSQHALMRGGEIVQIYRSVEDAVRTGCSFYEDGLFSVQEITQTPIDLGVFSRAVRSG